MMKLRHWTALARWLEGPDDKRPLPQELRRALGETAAEVRRLATEPGPELKKALAENAAELRRLGLDQPEPAEVEKALDEIAAKGRDLQLEQRELAKALGVRLQLMHRLMMAPRPATGPVAAAMAKAAGLTACEIEAFRAEEKEAYATGLFEGRCEYKHHEKKTIVEDEVATEVGADPRTLRRWRKRTYSKVSREELQRKLRADRRKGS